MIHRYYKEGRKLDVAGLNQITVLIDRSETESTEVGLNEWKPNLIGPPHLHRDKDQIFYFTSGIGLVKIGEDEYKVSERCIAYIPAGNVHRTINKNDQPLTYLLFNIFNDGGKEGHKSFAEHIENVKMTRKQQAETGKADVENISIDFEIKKAKFFNNPGEGIRFDFGSNATILLLDRKETNRCELTLVSWPAGNKGALVAHKEKEQIFFVLNGSGWVTIGNETEEVKPGELIFVPRNTPHTTEAGTEDLTYLCMNGLSGEIKDLSFHEMFNRVSSARIERWKSGNKTIGE